ncbi:hypothetical protein BUALT_Bualt17G0027800 [Buddleja alternifolia]|uniref:DUF4283 domain-containing protein n=1 Tax=Buddleja alternifolia TaxID=168488 RepID=A0AAV6W755_9LAMI|nr:hypothetical protein BUALT_Bualt17G0027800 [Buddleja alternifolia]
MSRKLVSSVFLEDCAFELPDVSTLSVPFSILVASCIANIISCILGLDELCCSTHWIATSAILHIDSIFTVPAIVGSMMLSTSPLRINDRAYKRIINDHIRTQGSLKNKFNNGLNFAIAGSTVFTGDHFRSKNVSNLIWKGIPMAFQTQMEWFKKYMTEAGCKGGGEGPCKAMMDNALFWLGEMGVVDYGRAQGSSAALQWLREVSVKNVGKLLELENPKSGFVCDALFLTVRTSLFCSVRGRRLWLTSAVTWVGCSSNLESFFVESGSMEEEINRMERISLSELEKQEIEIPEGVWKTGSNPFDKVVVGRLLSGTRYNFVAFKETMLNAFKPSKHVDFEKLDNGHFLLNFEHQSDLDRVMGGGPWCFDNDLLVLKLLHENDDPLSVPLLWVEFYVLARGLPLSKMNEDMASFIGNSLGSYRSVDLARNGVS